TVTAGAIRLSRVVLQFLPLPGGLQKRFRDGAQVNLICDAVDRTAPPLAVRVSLLEGKQRLVPRPFKHAQPVVLQVRLIYGGLDQLVHVDLSAPSEPLVELKPSLIAEANVLSHGQSSFVVERHT